MTLPTLPATLKSIARAAAPAFLACCLCQAPGSPAQGITLTRRYRSGQLMVYQTEMRTEATVRTEPSGLKAFLPPLPTHLTTKQQNTVTVRAVRTDGSADLENHFDRFELESDLPERSPSELRESEADAQQNFIRQIRGQTLLVHYDRQGRLLRFEGADAILQSTDALLREPLREVLRLLLEQMGGTSLSPDHPVKLNDEWSSNFASEPTQADPWRVKGESTWRYSGKTRYGQVDAVIIDFRFTDDLTPVLGDPHAGRVSAEARAKGLEVHVQGHGQGRLLVALDDGRILQNHANIQHSLRATLSTLPGASLPPSDPATVEIASQTALHMEETRR
jgi:hypothetical protein